MQLVVIRHAIAEDRDVWARTGAPDDLRPLTSRGLRRMRRAARGLSRLIPKFDRLASSPLLRALQTAEIVAGAFGGIAIDEIPALAPGQRPETVGQWIGSRVGEDTLAVIGHEPDLGELVSWYLAGSGAFVSLRKGGACLLELSGPDPGSATLLWSLTPGQLRRIA